MRAFKTLTAASVLGLLAVPYAAWAQDAAPPQDAAAEEADAASIIVTGSRLGRSTFDTATPATVIGAAQIA